MPEIKHQFTGGKMNKDNDERLVPKGEYRDAMNIQVHTSEGADVGTVTNVLGNTPGCTYDISNPNPIIPGMKTVGSITDEKNDSLYWFVANQGNPQNYIPLTNSSPISFKDIIMRKTEAGCEPVLIDQFAFLTPYESTTDSDFIVLDDASLNDNVTIGMNVAGYDNDGNVVFTDTIVNSVGSKQNFTLNYQSTSLTSTVIPVYSYEFAVVLAAADGPNAVPNTYEYMVPWNFIFITNFVGDPSHLINDQLVLEQEQVFTIVNAYFVNVTFNDGTGMDVVQLELDINLSQLNSMPIGGDGAIAITQELSGLSGTGSFVYGWEQTISGSPITGVITSDVPTVNTTPTNEINVLPTSDHWLDNIYDLLQDSNVKIKLAYANPGWQTNGCIDPTTVSSATDNTYSIVDCDDMLTPVTPNGFLNKPLSLEVFGGAIDGIFLNRTVQHSGATSLLFSSPRALNFSSDRLITAVNIIDDMLLWTDGHNEPKKINITQSVENTINNLHTTLDNYPIREEHVTVIKRSPTSQLSLDLIPNRNPDLVFAGIIEVSSDPTTANNINGTESDFSSFSNNAGSNIVQFQVATAYNENINDVFQLEWSVGDKLVLKEFSDDDEAPQIPIKDFRIKGTIIDWQWNQFNAFYDSSGVYDGAYVSMRIDAISGVPPTSLTPTDTRKYVVDKFNESDNIFEFKFPRFSYRYKYKDNQYSVYAPFTEVAFNPGSYWLDSKLGYNAGMTNHLKEIVIKNFRTDDMPVDVESIDILYKEDSAPNVYLVETIRQDDENTLDNNTTNKWMKNELVIKSDNLYAMLPENQLLRPWDNVPKKAVAQELTGNRVVYGNYTQGYDLRVSNKKFNPSIQHSLQAYAQEDSSNKSIKSLRNYQLGVVLADKYGRETSILTNESGAFKTDKASASTTNFLTASLQSDIIPTSMEYFKFYIKENSGEYYNMPMDRYYDAEDDALWISFLSSDRNKIDEETFLILKKGTDSNEIVKEKARYKILAIANEAPDFIKTTFTNIGEVRHDDNEGPFGGSLDNAPKPGVNEFSATNALFLASSLKNINEITDDLYVEFHDNVRKNTFNRYKITSVNLDKDAGENIYFKTEDFLGDELDLFNDGSKIRPNTTTRIIRGKVENKAQFDGRFFVKIYNDDVFLANVASEEAEENTEYRAIVSKKIYLMAFDHHNRHVGASQGAAGKYGGKVFPQHTNNTVMGSALPWDFTTADPAKTPYIDDEAKMTWRWSSFRSFFKTSRTVAEQSSNSKINFVKHYMRHGDGKSNNGEASVRREDDSVLITKDNINSKYQDVFFIDNGPFVATGNKMGSNQTSNFNINTASGEGKGITNWTTSNVGRINLGLGPLEPDKWWDPWNNNNENSGNYWQTWGDGTQSTRETYNKYDPLLKGITAGHKFRWKEDPSNTVYTTYGSWTQRNRKRYIQPKTQEGATVQFQQSNGWYKNAPYFDGSNNTPVSEFYFSPAMTAWEPTSGGGAGNEGIITGTRVIDKYIVHDSTVNPTTTSVNNITGNSWGVDYVIVDNAQLDNTIDTAWGGSTANSDLSEYNIQQITPGMILTSIGGSLPGGTTYGVLVKSVERNETANTSKITFEGYDSVAFTTLASSSGAIVFKQPSMNGLSVNSAANISSATGVSNFRGIGAVGYTMEFLEPILRDELLPDDPAVWETEPKEKTDLNIYYEVGGFNPTNLNVNTIKTVLPIGASIYSASNEGWPEQVRDNVTIIDNNDPNGNIIVVSELACTNPNGCSASGTTIQGIIAGSVLNIKKQDGSIYTVKVAEVIDDGDPFQDESRVFRIERDLHKNTYNLKYHNCYSFANGVESNRIRDSYNLPFISNGVRASATLPEEYKEEHRKHGLIYSGIFNSNSGINNLNQFIQAEKITKDLSPVYGSIQKLYSRSTADGDLIALCEDRVLKILANKDALYNADGDTNVIATNRVLGQATPYSGSYGISKNPESFAAESYRVYFTDKTRGAVLRLSKDGLTPISEAGMKNYFRDNLRHADKLIGSYDDKKDEYNLTIKSKNQETTVSYAEKVRGWVSFKSFVPENALSNSNDYYSFKDGNLWLHHSKDVDRNTFYGAGGFTPTSLEIIMNDAPSVIKSFRTLNYEGSQSQVNQLLSYNIYIPGTNIINPEYAGGIQDNQYYNNEQKDGWFVESLTTDQDEGSINEFIEKEGKWFNYIKGKQ